MGSDSSARRRRRSTAALGAGCRTGWEAQKRGPRNESYEPRQISDTRGHRDDDAGRVGRIRGRADSAHMAGMAEHAMGGPMDETMMKHMRLTPARMATRDDS